MRGVVKRMAGTALLALVAIQPAAFTPARCDTRDAGITSPASPSMADMPGMDHSRPDREPQSDPGAPAPAHGSGCDHSLPATGCAIGIGCVPAVAAPAIVVPPAVVASSAPYAAPTAAVPHVEYAPDTPPPRS